MNCSSCKSVNPDGARFCNVCGVELAAPVQAADTGAPSRATEASPDREAEFRLVTILFADVVGSTELGQRMGPEMAQGVMDRSLQRMSKAVDEYGGKVARLMGDGLLAFFGAPVAHEDDPERAALAAIRMHQALDDYATEVRLPLKLRVGINTGRVVTGDVGGEVLAEYTATGEAINLASRLQSAAEAGRSLLGENTARLIRHRFELEAVPPLTLKGFARAVTAFNLGPERRVPESARGISGLTSPLVGRETERHRIAESVEGLAAGKGGIASVIGEPGIGKSRILQQAMTDSEGMALRWAEGRAHSYAEDQPYGVILDLLAELLNLAPDDTPALLDLKLERMLVPLLGDSVGEVWPYLAVLIGAPVPARAAGGTDGLEPGVLNQRIIAAVCRTIEALASKRPLAVIFDDLHWVDLSSLNLIQALLPSTETAPLLLFLLFRPERDKPCWELKVRAETDFPHRYVELALGPLDDDSSVALIDSLLEVASIPEQVRHSICGASEGNPFFLEELIRDLIEEGQLVRRGDSWTVGETEAQLRVPDTLEKVVQARMDRLPRGERMTLQAASVIGRQFAFRVLEAITGPDGGLRQNVLGLQRADLIRERARIPELEYIFKHVLVQQVAYATLLMTQRKDLHRKAGETLERLFGDRLEEYSPMLAYHFRQAEDTRAEKYTVLAADAAMRLYANAEAIAHYTHALDLIDRKNAPTAQLLHLYTSRGRALELSGRYEEAIRNYAELESLAKQRSDNELELASLMATATLYSTPTGVTDPSAAQALSDQALALARSLGDRRAEAKILWNIMLLSKFAGRPAEVLQYGEQSLAIAREENLKEQVAYTLNDLAVSGYAGLGDLQRAQASLIEARSLWQELGNQPMLADSYGSSAVMHFFLGEFSQALEAAKAARQISEAIGNLWGQSYSRWKEGEVYAERGEYGLAIETMEACVRLGDQAGFVGASVGMRSALAMKYAELGALDKGIQICQIALDRANAKLRAWRGWPLAVMSHLARLRGDFQEAEAYLTEATSSASHLGFLFIGVVVSSAGAEAALVRGRPAAALSIAEEFLVRVTKQGAKAYVPDMLEVRGRALGVQGYWQASLQALTEALELAEAIGSRRTAWRIHAGLCRAQTELGNVEAAKMHGSKAKEIIVFIVDHVGSAELRASFLGLAEVRAISQM